MASPGGSPSPAPSPLAALSALFISSGFAIVIGVVAALFGIGFIEGSRAAYQTFISADRNTVVVIALPALAGILCALIARTLNQNLFLGLADTILLTQKNIQPRRRDNLASIAAAFVALCGGASVGLYGPITHLGSSLGSMMVRAKHGAPTLRTAAACGAAAAIAAAFNAPITALVFAHEVILRRYATKTFAPVTLAAIVGYFISTGVFARPTFLDIQHMTTLSPGMPFLFIVLGVLLGGLALGYLHVLFTINRRCAPLPLHWRLPIIGLLCGLILAAAPALTQGDQALLTASLDGFGFALAAALLLAKLCATWLCLGGGFPGGIISPTLVIGALLGIVFYHAAAALGIDAGIPITTFALCGMMAFVAPVIGKPLTAILFALELSGNYPISIAAAIAITICAQTFTRLGGQSYYDQQLKARGYQLVD